jgi:hypothetical protein
VIEGTAPPANRTIADPNMIQIGIDLELHLSAMTRATIGLFHVVMSPGGRASGGVTPCSFLGARGRSLPKPILPPQSLDPVEFSKIAGVRVRRKTEHQNASRD